MQKSAKDDLKRLLDGMKLDIKVQREFEEAFPENPDSVISVKTPPKFKNGAKIS